MTTATTPELPQPMQALALANTTFRGHSALKREVRDGLGVEEAMVDPRAKGNLTIASLLGAQKGWGEKRVRRVLYRLMIFENRRVDKLTERQRGLIAGEVEG